MVGTTTRVALARRILLVAITALVAALAMNAAKPAEAQAFVDPSIVFSSYQGWGAVRDEPVACPAIYPQPAYCSQPSTAVAYRWNAKSRSWSTLRIYGGTQVYIYPFSGDWMWIWTQRTDWLAIKRGSLTTGKSCPTGAYC